MCRKLIWFSPFGGLSGLVKENSRCVLIWYTLTSKIFWDCSTGLCFRYKLRKHGLDVISMKWVYNGLIDCSQKYLSVAFCQAERASQAGSCIGQSFVPFYSIPQFWFECRITKCPCKIYDYQDKKVSSTWGDSTESQNDLHKYKQRGNTALCQSAYSSFGLVFIYPWHTKKALSKSR